METKQVLVVEDDPELSELIGNLLEEKGYRPRTFASQKEFENAGVNVNDFSAFLIDRILPHGCGLDIVRHLREEEATAPILMVAGDSDSLSIVQGLKNGADDYVTKPFNGDVLIARLERLMDRFNRLAGRSFGDLSVDERAFELICGNERVRFTRTEFMIFRPLFKNLNSFIKREELFDGDPAQKSRSLDVHVASIRKKVKSFGLDVETLRGVGYRLSRID